MNGPGPDLAELLALFPPNDYIAAAEPIRITFCCFLADDFEIYTQQLA